MYICDWSTHTCCSHVHTCPARLSGQHRAPTQLPGLDLPCPLPVLAPSLGLQVRYSRDPSECGTPEHSGLLLLLPGCHGHGFRSVPGHKEDRRVADAAEWAEAGRRWPWGGAWKSSFPVSPQRASVAWPCLFRKQDWALLRCASPCQSHPGCHSQGQQRLRLCGHPNTGAGPVPPAQCPLCAGPN